MILTTDAALVIAYDAGFRDYDLISIVSIGHAESGLDTSITGHNPPTNDCPNGSLDRGWLQINDCYQAWVSNADAYDANGAARAAFIIMRDKGGLKNWSSYVAGTYKAFIRMVTDEAMALRLISPIVTPGVEEVTINVPASWISEVSAKVGIADPTATPNPTPTPEINTYTVEQGDTLSGIAHKITGDEGQWTRLYQLNSALIGADPNFIVPGQVLTLPSDWPKQ